MKIFTIIVLVVDVLSVKNYRAGRTNGHVAWGPCTTLMDSMPGMKSSGSIDVTFEMLPIQTKITFCL